MDSVPLLRAAFRVLASQISVLEHKKALKGWSLGRGFPFRSEQLRLVDCVAAPAGLMCGSPSIAACDVHHVFLHRFSFPGMHLLSKYLLSVHQ